MEIEIPPLPKGTDKFFTSEGDWWTNACLNYLPDGWGTYALGYRKAADIIVDYIDSKKRFQDQATHKQQWNNGDNTGQYRHQRIFQHMFK